MDDSDDFGLFRRMAESASLRLGWKWTIQHVIGTEHDPYWIAGLECDGEPQTIWMNESIKGDSGELMFQCEDEFTGEELLASFHGRFLLEAAIMAKP